MSDNTYFATIPRDIVQIIGQLVCNNGPMETHDFKFVVNEKDIVKEDHVMDPYFPRLIYQENELFAHHNCEICAPSKSYFYMIYTDRIVSACGKILAKHPKVLKNNKRLVTSDGYQHSYKMLIDPECIDVKFVNILTGEKTHQIIPEKYYYIIFVSNDYIYGGIGRDYKKISRKYPHDMIKICQPNIDFVLNGPKSTKIAIIDRISVTLQVNDCLIHSNHKRMGQHILYHNNSLYFISNDHKIMQWSLDFLA